MGAFRCMEGDGDIDGSIPVYGGKRRHRWEHAGVRRETEI